MLKRENHSTEPITPWFIIPCKEGEERNDFTKSRSKEERDGYCYKNEQETVCVRYIYNMRED